MGETIETDFGTFDDFEDFLDAVRLRNYEETKHMTREERAVRLIARTDPIIKQFGLKLVTLPPVERKWYAPKGVAQPALSEVFAEISNG